METTKIIRRNVDFQLNQAEYAEYGSKLAQIEGQILALEEERSRYKRQLKAQINILEQQKALVSRLIRAGKETRDVDVVEVKDYENKVVRYLHGARLVDSRPMLPEECQLEIPAAVQPVTPETEDDVGL